MNIKIRLAKKNEGPGIYHVIERAWMDTYPNQKYGITRKGVAAFISEKKKGQTKLIINDKVSHSWVALDGDRIVGVCRAKNQDGKNYLGATYVLKEYRGLGIGSKLLMKVVDWYGTSSEIVTEVACYNENAIKFYKKHGFIKPSVARKIKATAFPNGEIMPIFRMIRNKNH